MITMQQPPKPLYEQRKSGHIYKSNVWRFMNVIAAVIITALLVGSFTLLFSLVRQNRTLTGASPTSFPSAHTYMTFRMNGIAMEPTLRNQSLLEIDTSAYRSHQSERGDMIALHPPAPLDSHFIYIKRVIAIPGDVITIDGTKVIVNGKLLHEPYVSPKNQGNPFSYKKITNMRIPPHEYFVLGDNRAASDDSRDWGPVLQKNIIGKVIGVKTMPAPTSSHTPIGAFTQPLAITPNLESEH